MAQTKNVFGEIKKFLQENTGELRSVISSINSYDGSFESCDVWENDEEFFDTFFEGKPLEAVRAAQYGDYNYTDDYVKFNGYGNLESLDEWQYDNLLLDHIDEVVDYIINTPENVDLPEEIEEILEDAENE